jgi:hypothetical protein
MIIAIKSYNDFSCSKLLYFGSKCFAIFGHVLRNHNIGPRREISISLQIEELILKLEALESNMAAFTQVHHDEFCRYFG